LAVGLIIAVLQTSRVYAADSDFNQRYGIWFIFESTCSACMKFAPVLKQFTDKHHIFVKAISRDGRGIRTWPGEWAKDKNGTIYRLGAEDTPTPTLVLRDSVTGTNLPIGIGIMTTKQLNDRLYQLTNINLEEQP
jgi:hypothetical protein